MGIDHEGVWAALEGRSLWRFGHYEVAPLASFFARTGLVAGQVARLTAGDGNPIAAARVSVTWTTTNGSVVFTGDLITDGDGGVPLPMPAPPPGTYVLHLRFAGERATAAGAASLLLTL